MSNQLKNTVIAGASAVRTPSEVEHQLDALDGANSRLQCVLTEFREHLQSAGVLTQAAPEPEDKPCGETGPNSPMGNRIRGVRADLHSIAAEFESLLARLAV